MDLFEAARALLKRSPDPALDQLLLQGMQRAMNMVCTALRGAALLPRAACTRLSADQSIRHSLRYHAHSQTCVEAWRCPRLLIMVC
eukprot:COSAG01_NODE_8846_length_2638_cov_6.417487_2_plen_86_part_00